MTGFAKRNLKVFFRDKSAVFFSLLASFIIIGLYVFFLGDVWVRSMSNIANARELMDNWIMAGLLAVTSVTTTMGAFGIMINDKTRKIVKDLYSSPLKRSGIAGGYIISAYVIGLLLSFITLILAEIYIVCVGGALISLTALLKVIGMIFLATFVNTSIVLFIVSFFNSENAFATASTIIGTLIGFITGIYLPIGQLPEAVQFIIKVFPVSHSASLLRQIMMADSMNASFEGTASVYAAGFKEMLGVTLNFGDSPVSPGVSIIILLVTALIFYSLSVFNISRKSK